MDNLKGRIAVITDGNGDIRFASETLQGLRDTLDCEDGRARDVIPYPGCSSSPSIRRVKSGFVTVVRRICGAARSA
jgi:hypothetical protein